MWSFFSRDPTVQFNYELGEEVSTSRGHSVWRLHAGKNKTTGEAVSMFVVDMKTADEAQIDLAKKSLKRFKTLRHPNIVTYINDLESDKVLYLVTENVIPLEKFLHDSSLSAEKKHLEFGISWGLHQVVSGIKFLNDANLVHNNICLSSIFVDCSGEWKIGGLEFMFASNESPVQTLLPLKVHEPPEVCHGGSHAQKQFTARDMWGFGCLLWEVFNGMLSKSTQLKVPGKIPQSLVPNYCELVSANPKSRPAPAKVLMDCKSSGSYLDNEFVKAMIFIEELDIKDQQEKLKFFDKLSQILDRFPQSICQYKILPKLLKAYEFGGAGSCILSPILKLGKYLDEAEYQQKIVPCVVKLFSSPDRATRVKLLQQLDVFAAHLKPKTVNEQIFPSVIQGFMDTNPMVRETTIKAIIHLAPKLGYKPLNEEVMKHFARLQSKDPEGGIRTNTTICLGKIACYLNPQIRQKILISAFTRGVRDPYRPARLAAIQAMAATQKFYTVNDIATRLMPTLVALTVDDDPSVREAVFKVIKCFLSNLEKVSENPDLITEMEKDVKSSDAAAYDDSWAGWAMSLTSKLYKQKTSPVSNRSTPEKSEQPEPATRSSVQEPLQPSSYNNKASPPQVSPDEDLGDVGWSDAWNDDNDFKDDLVAGTSDTALGTERVVDDWGDLEDWGSMDEPQQDEDLINNFKPSDPSLASSSNYDWDTSSDDFLNTNDDDFFSSVVNSKPSRTSAPTRTSKVGTTERKPVQKQVDCNDEWSSESWGDFDEPKKEKRLPKSKPMKLGAKKIVKD